MAAATTIAATSTSDYLGSHPGAAAAGRRLTHGFAAAFWVLAAIAALAAVVSRLVVESRPAVITAELEHDDIVLEPAA